MYNNILYIYVDVRPTVSSALIEYQLVTPMFKKVLSLKPVLYLIQSATHPINCTLYMLICSDFCNKSHVCYHGVFCTVLSYGTT